MVVRLDESLPAGVLKIIDPETAPVTQDELNTFIGRVQELNACVEQMKAQIEQLTAERDKLQVKLEKITHAVQGHDSDV